MAVSARWILPEHAYGGKNHHGQQRYGGATSNARSYR